MINLTPAPIEVYSSAGNPAAAAHLANAENALQQQDLNNLHGGNPTTTITLPQAPTMGGQIVSPPPSVANSAYTTLINGNNYAQYDHLVGGGTTDSLLLRLQKLVPNQKKNKSKSNNKSKSKSKNKSKTKSKNKSKTKSKNKSKTKSKNQKKNKSKSKNQKKNKSIM